MPKPGPTLAEHRKKLVRGTPIKLSTGVDGVFLEFFKGTKAHAKCLVGTLQDSHGMVSDNVEGIVIQTWGKTWG